MSARKIENTQLFEPPSLQTQTTRLDLPAHAVRIRKNGIEFRSDYSIAPWTEMTVALETLGDPKKVNFSGVVVACDGNRLSGYQVSMVFTSLSRQAQARLSAMSVAP